MDFLSQSLVSRLALDFLITRYHSEGTFTNEQLNFKLIRCFPQLSEENPSIEKKMQD